MAIRPAKSEPDSITRGAVLTVAMRWTDRLIGVVSTLVLARLLLPDDFGVVAMASVVVALIDTLFDLGVNAALIQRRDATREDFDSAWTLRLLQSAAAAAVIGLVAAPLAARYFRDPRVIPVLWMMAVTVLAGGVENIGIVAFQKNLQFGREFRFVFLRRLAGFGVTILLAFWLRSYWAMVVGALAGRVLGVGLSYLMHEFRPRLSTRQFGAIWSFSQWMLLRNLGSFGALQTDKLAVGRRFDPATLGAYNLADDVSALPVSELLAPIGRALFPAFVRMADQPRELRDLFLLAFGMQTLVALPAGVGLAMVADSAVPLLLGPQWGAAVPLMQLLALISIATALTHASSYLLLALGRVRGQALFVCGHFLLLAVLVATLDMPTASAIAGVRLAVAVAATLAFLWMVLRAVPVLRSGDLLARCWRPMVGTAAMFLVLSLLSWPPEASVVLKLGATIAAGAAIYVVVVLLLWRIAGCPSGAECYLLERVGFWIPKADSPVSEIADDDRTAGPDPKLSIVVAKHTADLPPSALALLSSAGASNFELGRGWFDNLQATVYPHDQGVQYYAAVDGDTCRVLLPIRVHRDDRRCTIHSLSNYYTSLYAPLLDPATTVQDVAALLRRVAEDFRQPVELRFAPMDPEARSFDVLETALRLAGWTPYRYFCFGNWHFRGGLPWTDYLARRPGEVRSTIRRMARKFRAAGGTMEIIRDTSGIDAGTREFTQVYEASWKRPEPHPEFIPGLVRHLAESGFLRLGIARLGAKPVAAQLWATQPHRAAIYKLAYDRGEAEFSPGTLLTAVMMEEALDHDRVSEVDYLIGDDAYKKDWMDRRRERWGLVAYNRRTLAGCALALRESTARLLKRAAGRFAARTGGGTPIAH